MMYAIATRGHALPSSPVSSTNSYLGTIPFGSAEYSDSVKTDVFEGSNTIMVKDSDALPNLAVVLGNDRKAGLLLQVVNQDSAYSTQTDISLAGRELPEPMILADGGVKRVLIQHDDSIGTQITLQGASGVNSTDWLITLEGQVVAL